MTYFKKFRTAKGYTQVQVAKELGVSKQVYNNYELGKREADFETLLKLAEFFDTTVDALLRGEPDTVPEPSEEEGKKESAPLKVIRSEFENKLSGLSDTDLTELETFIQFLRYRQDHSSDC